MDSVIYHIHPSYKVQTVVAKTHPYLMSRTAFGKFSIGVEVVFKEWTGLESARIDYLLDFSEAGKSIMKEFAPFDLFKARHRSNQD